MSEYILCTLNTTQEIIAKVVEATDTHYIVAKPLMISVVQTGETTYGLRMDPFSPSNPDGDQRINRATLASESVVVPPGLIKAYQQQTSSIEIVSALPGQM